MLVYLAGSIWGVSDSHAQDWRRHVEDTIGADKCLNPLRHELRPQHEHLDEIVVLDKMDIRRADVILVYYTEPSEGTAMEIFYAHSLGKPIVVVNKSNKNQFSPWITYHMTITFDWLSDAVKWIGDHIA